MSETPTRPFTTELATPPAPYVAPGPDYRTLAYVVHGLYAASFITGFTAIVGVVIAYMKRAEAAGTIYESHFAYAIRTFWIGLAMSLAGFVLCFLLIGFLVLALVAVWFIVRIVRPILALSEDRPVNNPTGFF